ncbi:hypothetical protein [Cetobacterium sp.]|uniref:hypothetical protein n=1 Tax=Cetobacterium sp. TaxID=2071632 RepID=UPI003F3B2D6B
MKKVLLGLLALSAALMAESAGVTEVNGENQIDITTKAFIVDSGLIITETPDGGAIQSVELDHGTIIKGTQTSPSITKDIYIRKSNTTTSIPGGAILNVTLKSPHNDLASGDGMNRSKIPHTLTASIDRSSATAQNNSNQNLILAGNAQDSTLKTNYYIVNDGGVNSIKVTLNSTIAANDLSNDKVLNEGTHSNTSTLSVKYSKIPTIPGETVKK